METTLYVIIVDGLRADFGKRHFDGLNRWVAEGKAAYTTLRSGLPSDSRPSYALIATGVDGEVNTITGNGVRHRCPTPNIFGLARQAGLRTGGSLYYWWSELFNKTPFDPTTDRRQQDRSRDIQDGFFYDADETPDDVVFQEAREIRSRWRPHLLVIHPMSVDYAGDNLGGAAGGALPGKLRPRRGVDPPICRRGHGGRAGRLSHRHRRPRRPGSGRPWGRQRRGAPRAVLAPGPKAWLVEDRGVYDQRALAPTILTLLGLDIPTHMSVPPLPLLL